jgi:anti-anti-sigma factor
MKPAPFSVSVEGRRVCLAGELDMSTRSIFERELAELSPQGAIRIDLSELSFMDSTGLHAIVALARRCASDVILEDPQRAVRRILEIAGIDERTGVRVEPSEG